MCNTGAVLLNNSLLARSADFNLYFLFKYWCSAAEQFITGTICGFQSVLSVLILVQCCWTIHNWHDLRISICTYRLNAGAVLLNNLLLAWSVDFNLYLPFKHWCSAAEQFITGTICGLQSVLTMCNTGSASSVATAESPASTVANIKCPVFRCVLITCKNNCAYDCVRPLCVRVCVGVAKRKSLMDVWWVIL